MEDHIIPFLQSATFYYKQILDDLTDSIGVRSFNFESRGTYSSKLRPNIPTYQLKQNEKGKDQYEKDITLSRRYYHVRWGYHRRTEWEKNMSHDVIYSY